MLGVGADQDHVAQREPDIARVLELTGLRVGGKGRCLHIGRLLQLHEVIDEAAAEQLRLEGLQEVLLDLDSIGPTGVLQIQRAQPPQRHLLQADQIRPGRGDLGRQQPAPDAEVGPGDDLVHLAGRLAEGDQRLLALQSRHRIDHAVDVRTQIDVAGHHGDRDRSARPHAGNDDEDHDRGDDQRSRKSDQEAGPALHPANDAWPTPEAGAQQDGLVNSSGTSDIEPV